MAKEYDLVIIGGGTGGYVAAIRASQLGLKTAIVEKEKLGGTCLHAGCIPTKTLLKSAEVYQTVKRSREFGMKVEKVALDFEKVQERKQYVVETLHKGVQFLMQRGKIDIYYGTGRILGPSIFSPLPGTVSVEKGNGEDNELLIPQYVLVATGSRPKQLPGLEADGKMILTSDDALRLEQLPKSMLIIGGGVIGVEWASMLADFDVKVTIVEYAKRILPTEDEEISKEMTRQLKKKGIQIFTGAKIIPDSLKKDSRVTVQMERNGELEELQADQMLVSIGREANIEGIGLENTAIRTGDGFIEVNPFCQTEEKHIYAIGDCIGGMQLAHVASREGIIAVEHMKGLNPDPLDYRLVPKAIYSNPEAASIGFTTEEAIEKGYKIKMGKFPFKGIGKALIQGETDGFAKMIVDEATDDLLGIHIIGPKATELISEASLSLFLNAIPWEINQTIHPHPSLSEIFAELSLSVDGKAIHG
ncbi:dihydrolipoyl dehydrogenase [Fervidibacillus halotolerans]|uniref:Dihydrolipoyl dehydrogenase n=1 Tax=Fervidibacillus halotolerans TaxID=2980027 RepID=A0A9E8LXT1_9BACI|nr:dihydrolipoyl dehydrogenase [Fervidibacillus halotolerans]WAA11407.1 dihydrolipoyl dehydrogenase [Fervidibacillus halotolerans]